MQSTPRSSSVRTESFVPTESLLGPWSMTALAALLVVGGILMLLPGKRARASADSGAASLHPVMQGTAVSSAAASHAAPGNLNLPSEPQAGDN